MTSAAQVTITPFKAEYDDLSFEWIVREATLELNEQKVVEAAMKATKLPYEWLRDTMIPRRLDSDLKFDIAPLNLPQIRVSFDIFGVTDDGLTGMVRSGDWKALEIWERYQEYGILDEEAIISMVDESCFENIAVLRMLRADRSIELHVASGPEVAFEGDAAGEVWDKLRVFKKMC